MADVSQQLMQEMAARTQPTDPMLALRKASKIGAGPLNGVDVTQAGLPSMGGIGTRVLTLLGLAPKALQAIEPTVEEYAPRIAEMGKAATDALSNGGQQMMEKA